MAGYKAEIQPTTRGYTLTVRSSTQVVRRVVRIATLEEARRRAQVWKREQGARIIEKKGKA